MSLLFLINQKEEELAVAEAKAIAYGWEWWTHKERPIDGVLLLPRQRVRDVSLKRSPPGLSHSVVKLLATCPVGNLRSTLTALPWKRIVGDSSYRVRLVNKTEKTIPYTERELANAIASSYKGSIDLEHPDITIDIVVTKDAAHIGLRLWEQKEDFQARRAHLLPAMHPSMMHPAIARALVNISCARRIHDPFCGAGGLLIEAGLAGRQASGADIEQSMLVRARQNTHGFKLRPNLRIADATVWLPRAQAIITDMPYGKNTKPVALSHLFEAFLSRAKPSTRRIIVGLPTAIPVPKGWVLRAHITSYVHKSMTKHFYVLERN
jgi:tRNA (guanine10-N2)-dimethyltransferase